MIFSKVSTSKLYFLPLRPRAKVRQILGATYGQAALARDGNEKFPFPNFLTDQARFFVSLPTTGLP